MKSELRYTAIAMMWAMILLAAYAVADPQAGARNHQNNNCRAAASRQHAGSNRQVYDDESSGRFQHNRGATTATLA